MQGDNSMYPNGEARVYIQAADATMFLIGGKPVPVPPISFWIGETLDAEMSSITPAIRHNDYVNVVLKIICTCIEAHKAGPDADPDPEAVETLATWYRRRLSIAESQKFYDLLTELYRNSGFTIPEAVTPPVTEAQANGA